MGVTEIVLIIIGAVILILGYVLPIKKKETTAPVKVDENQVKELVEKGLTEAKSQINDMVDETINYSMEKTERKIERLTNEKIMAVNEYSDTVLESINKNHKEVMFLYDMLNDKHENLVNTVSEAAQKAKEIKQTVQDAEITIKEALIGSLPETEDQEEFSEKTVDAEEKEDFVPISPPKVEIIKDMMEEQSVNAVEADSQKNDNQKVTESEKEKADNHNEEILRLHKLGKSPKAIAKELGLGVGEVRLVIELFKKAK